MKPSMNNYHHPWVQHPSERARAGYASSVCLHHRSAVSNGIGICGRTDILAATRYPNGGGVATVSFPQMVLSPQKQRQNYTELEQEQSELVGMLALRRLHMSFCMGKSLGHLFVRMKVGERVIEGPELIEVTNKKVAVAKEKLKEARYLREEVFDVLGLKEN
nr:hypothetical protein [Tanacetum cinerariifolium]